MTDGQTRNDPGPTTELVELRGRVAQSLYAHADTIVKDSTAVYAFAGLEHVEIEDRSRLASAILKVMTVAVREGAANIAAPGIGDIVHEAEEKRLGSQALFGIVYLMERAALDELALDDSIGAMSEPWPAIAQVVRRSSFDVCAALADRRRGDITGNRITDALVGTLHTEPVLVAAVDKEIQRSERYGHPFALVLLDVDHLRAINAQQGYGAGNRVIERIGIVVRNYFRDTDWVARLGGGTFGVLLPEIVRSNAAQLAERVRVIVAERLELHDYRSEQQFPVSVSVGVVVIESIERTVSGEELMSAARSAMRRAKVAGGNRVETQLVAG